MTYVSFQGLYGLRVSYTLQSTASAQSASSQSTASVHVSWRALTPEGVIEVPGQRCPPHERCLPSWQQAAGVSHGKQSAQLHWVLGTVADSLVYASCRNVNLW